MTHHTNNNKKHVIVKLKNQYIHRSIQNLKVSKRKFVWHDVSVAV